MRIVYLDHNATCPLKQQAREAILAVMEEDAGNPSSLHQIGRKARGHVERARTQLAILISAQAAEVVFTSGGTEANALAIVGTVLAAVRAGCPARVITSVLEHPSVHGACERLQARGVEIVRVAVDDQGRLSKQQFAHELASGAALVTLALANHEIGTVVDVADFAAQAREANVLVHCDAVQALGKMTVDVGALGVDLLSLSAHKIGGPPGVGALWVRRGIELDSLWSGGHQEKGQRTGTENLLGIVGFGAAAQAATLDQASVRDLRDQLERIALAIEGARCHGAAALRLCNTSNIAFAGASGELVVTSLDLEGVCASTGAACSSGSVEPSPIILALGQTPGRAAEAVRFSLGPQTTADDIHRVGQVLPPIVARVRAAAAGGSG